MADNGAEQAKAELNPRQKAVQGLLGTVDLNDRRQQSEVMIETVLKSFPPLSSDFEEYWIDIPINDWTSKTKIIKPKNRSSLPLIVMFYGGGFAGGSPSQMTRPGREWAEKFGACVALPSYRLCPEVKFPVPQQDSYEAVRWLSLNAEKELGADLSSAFIVGGVSAGGTMAAAIAGLNTNAHSRDVGRQIPNLAKPLTGVYLACPQVFTEDTLPSEYKSIWRSREDNKDVEPLTADRLDMILTLLDADPKSPWFSPGPGLSWSSDSYPPTYFQACGGDVLRDDAVVLEKILSERGIRTKIDVFHEDPHATWSVVPYESKSSNPTLEEGTMNGMEWLLQQK